MGKDKGKGGGVGGGNPNHAPQEVSIYITYIVNIEKKCNFMLRNLGEQNSNRKILF